MFVQIFILIIKSTKKNFLDKNAYKFEQLHREANLVEISNGDLLYSHMSMSSISSKIYLKQIHLSDLLPLNGVKVSICKYLYAFRIFESVLLNYTWIYRKDIFPFSRENALLNSSNEPENHQLNEHDHLLQYVFTWLNENC